MYRRRFQKRRAPFVRKRKAGFRRWNKKANNNRLSFTTRIKSAINVTAATAITYNNIFFHYPTYVNDGVIAQKGDQGNAYAKYFSLFDDYYVKSLYVRWVPFLQPTVTTTSTSSNFPFMSSSIDPNDYQGAITLTASLDDPGYREHNVFKGWSKSVKHKDFSVVKGKFLQTDNPNPIPTATGTTNIGMSDSNSYGTLKIANAGIPNAVVATNAVLGRLECTWTVIFRAIKTDVV